jgi:hypothetical protein
VKEGERNLTLKGEGEVGRANRLFYSIFVVERIEVNFMKREKSRVGEWVNLSKSGFPGKGVVKVGGKRSGENFH